YCSLGINIDNHNNFTPTTNAFECLDELTSKPLGTHFWAYSNWKRFNSIFLGAQDGSNNAITHIDDIKVNLTPEKINKTPDLVFEIVLGAYVGLMATAVAALGASAIAGEVVTTEVGVEANAIYVENEAVVAEANFGKELITYAEKAQQE
ncbi:2239_t:CDS:2, partial [Racocetra persica]